MKSYYYNCTVTFTDKEMYKYKENYSGIVKSENEEEGKVVAKKEGLKQLKSDLGNKLNNIKIIINEFYKTFDSARSS